MTAADEAVATFTPEPRSARGARAFLADFLTSAGRPDLVDAAELPLSEVVTNAVLHSHTSFTVSLRLVAEGLRVEVVDQNPLLPVPRNYAAEATTGRGLGLVAMVTAAHGVERLPFGKCVWFLVADAPTPERTPDDLLAAWDIDLDIPVPGWSGRVQLLAMPPRLWLAAREHHDALSRELALYSAGHPGAVAPAALATADRARGWISQALIAELEAHGVDVRGAESRSLPMAGLPDAVDLTLAVDADAATSFATLQDVLDTGEDLAVRGYLLTRPGLPEVLAVRNWACEQAIAQTSGAEPAPWPGTAQERFTVEVHDRQTPAPPADLDRVSGADVGVIAADDANRIVAVSVPLASALGWTPGELVGRRVVAIVPERLREAHVAGFSRHVTTGRATVLGQSLRMPVLCRDGSEVDADVRIERIGGGFTAWITPDA